ncbi:DUF84 family protein [Metasolibacillus sp.]|uniref:DUF84 family protein n=1 Tax=Metasolibacillus sp. TaxID=2703680 RepID=UPI0025E868FE|nr:DUF84 family protein [Metasolibacillus sp.]MCT6925827.1 DUF84 family protein [Metasolibacillus sp.]MCT6941984.1 DUF84 family protein [Metasolibacillus sp.]
MLVAIGTQNKAKTSAVEKVVRTYFPEANFIHINVESGVAAQPMSAEETRQGAINRAKNTLQQTEADWGFGLEGGVHQLEDTLYCCNWGAIALRDGTVISSAGAQFMLPNEVANEVHAGQELGPVMDAFAQKENTRHNEGAIGIFTNGLINRQQMFEHIVTLLVGQVLYLNNK